MHDLSGMENNYEFERGYNDSISRNKPWHIETAERYNPAKVSTEYIEGYARGYAALMLILEDRYISAYCFSFGYQDCINGKEPALHDKSYIEGYALARADKLAPETTKKYYCSLDDFLELQREIICTTLYSLEE